MIKLNKLYLKNTILELIIIMVISSVGLYYDFERIIFLGAVFCFLFEGFYNKYRTKEMLVDNSFELVKSFLYGYIFIILIRYLLDPMLLNGIELGDGYLFNRLAKIMIIYLIIIVFKITHKRDVKVVSFDNDGRINNKLIIISLVLSLVHINLNFYNKIALRAILVIIHFIIIKNINAFYLKGLLILGLIISFFAGNFVSMALLLIYFLNIKEANKRNIKTELDKINEIELTN